MSQGNSTCEFCSIHEPGVYILNLSGIVVLCLVVIVYWREVSALCFGTSKIVPIPEIPSQVAVGQPALVENIIAQKMAKSPTLAQPLPQTTQPILAPPRVQHEYQQPAAQPFSLGLHKSNKDFTRLPATKQVAETPPTQNDAFKLPKPEPKVNTSKESTGSNYFKQMMRGKHPVLSISQYEIKRLNKLIKKPDKEGGKKKNHHHRRKKKQI